MKKVIAYVLTSALVVVPVIAFAQQGDGTANGAITSVNSTLVALEGVINTILILLAGVAIVVFIYGLLQFLLKTGEEDRKSARNYMIYGIITFCVIAGLYGIVNLLINLFGVSNSGQNLTVPQL